MLACIFTKSSGGLLLVVIKVACMSLLGEKGVLIQRGRRLSAKYMLFKYVFSDVLQSISGVEF